MMKRFGTGNAPFIANNGNIPEGNSGELTRPTNQFFNNVYGENKRLIEASGQALQTLVADDNQQTAKAAFIHSTVAPSVIVSGGNTKVLAVRGSLVLPANVLLDGALLSFECNSTTTGAVFITLNGVPYPLLWQGAVLDATTVLHASLSYQIKYDQPNARFILVTPPQSYFDGLIQAALNAQFDTLYPVGVGRYISYDGVNPTGRIRGVWTLDVAASGRVGIGMGTTTDGRDTLTFNIADRSGEFRHVQTESELAQHNHTTDPRFNKLSAHFPDIENDPNFVAQTTATFNRTGDDELALGTNGTGTTLFMQLSALKPAGNSQPMNITQPYYVHAVWRRTA
jgi:hypothetical protein